MKTVRVKIDPQNPAVLPVGRVDYQILDSTTESQLADQQKIDDAEAMQDSEKFARRVRKRLGLTQEEFSIRIEVPINTIRNWEQGKRSPTRAAKALLRVLDKSPELLNPDNYLKYKYQLKLDLELHRF
jgi:putative transcriptional regulator